MQEDGSIFLTRKKMTTQGIVGFFCMSVCVCVYVYDINFLRIKIISLHLTEKIN